MAELPVSYREVTPSVLPDKTPPVPETSSQLQGGSTVNGAMEKELDWLEDVNGIIKNHPSLEDKKTISYAAYQSTTDQQWNRAGLSALSALLPLFPNQAKSMAMIRHAMDVIKACVNYLNPVQVPVVASSLYMLLQKAYAKYSEGLNDGDDLLFDDWCAQQVFAVPQFQFWYISLQLKLSLLVFIRSLCQANFRLYTDTLHKMLPWFFALNHTNYARWLHVHLRDTSALQQTAPGVFLQFEKGLFTVHMSPRRFSAIAICQAHEQNNGMVKGDGGAVGLTENPSALRRWMISGPETARLVSEFEASMTTEVEVQGADHHEVQRSSEVSFFKDMKSLVTTIEDFGNPFLEESEDLIVMDTKEIAGPTAVTILCQIEAIGKQQCNQFITERLLNRTKSPYDPIKRKIVSLINFSAPKESCRTSQ